MEKGGMEIKMKKWQLQDIRIRDPFFLKENGEYYLYGTTDVNTWEGNGEGFDCYRSKDLKLFQGPYPVFRAPQNFWADRNFWAPEVWKYRGRYYMIASFKAEGRCRGVQVLISDDPRGPFVPVTDGPVTPTDWECLDGTLCFEDDGVYMVFCHEWIQTGDGCICAAKMSGDLTKLTGEPEVLFHASEAEWPVIHREFDSEGFVTDGPFLFRDENSRLHMIWSSYGEKGYAVGISHAQKGVIGKWNHERNTVLEKEGGHGMIFEGPEGRTLLVVHTPNTWLKERVKLYSVEKLILGG